MLSVDTIARVIVTASRASASPSSFDTGLLMVRDTNFAAAKRLKTYTSSSAAAEGLTEDGFGATTDAYKMAVKYFGASPAPTRLLVSCYPTSETPAEALGAVLNTTSGFYGVCFDTAPGDSDLLALAGWIEAAAKPMILFLPFTGTAGTVLASETLAALVSSAYRRVLPAYVSLSSDIGAILGTAMGLKLSHTASSFSLCYKTIHGIQPTELTETQVNAFKALNTNVYITRGYTHLLLESGTVASGERYDEILYMDCIADELQNEAVTLLAENPDRMPQTDDATAMFINRFTRVLMNYRRLGVLYPAAWRGSNIGPISMGDIVENGFALWAESYDDQSASDRALHKAMPINVALTFAGSLESVVISVNVQI